MTELLQEQFRMEAKNGNLLAIKIGQAVSGQENYGIYLKQQVIRNGKKKQISSADF